MYPNKPLEQIFAGRIDQARLEELIALHERFVLGIRGGKRLVLQFMNLSGLSFRERNLADGIFTGSAFIQADLTGAVFDRANLFGCDLRHAILDGASLKKADLRGVCARGARLNGADMLQADLREGQILISELSRELQALYVEIEAPANRGATGDLSMHHADARLSRTKLSDVATAAADFREAEMGSVRMRHAQARGANFEGANMENIDLSGADMTGVNLSDANMLGAVMEQTKLDGAILTGLVSDRTVKTINALETGLDVLIQSHQAWVASAGHAGEALDLSGYDMRAVSQFMQAKLTAIKAERAVFFGMNLTGIELQHSHLALSDFRNCTLSQADFRGSDLTGCKFNKARIHKADFQPLTINGVRKPVNLRQANFRHCDLRGTNFRHADLTGADFSYAWLDGADLRHAILTDAVLDGANLSNVMVTETEAAGPAAAEPPLTAR